MPVTFHVLMWGFHHIHNIVGLFRFYRRHHAEQFLRSGITSQTPHSWRAAFRLLWWLTANHRSPADW
jgi:hypothetical protein